MSLVLCLFLLGAVRGADPPAPDPSGTLLVVRPDEDAVALIDLETGEETARVSTGRVPHQVAVSKDGRMAAVGEYGKKRVTGHAVTLVDLREPRVLSSRDLGEHAHPESVSFLRDGRLAVLSQKTGRFLLLDPGNDGPPETIATPWSFPGDFAITPNGKRAVVTHPSSGSVAILDLRTRRVKGEIAVGTEADGVATTSNGTEAWIAMQSGDRIAIVDIEKRRLVTTIPCPGFPIRIASVPSQGRMLVSCSRSHEIVAFDVATRQEVGRKTLDLSQQPGWSERSGANTFGSTPVPMRIAVAGDGKLAYVAADLAKAVVEIDARTLEIRRILAAGGRPGGLALSTLTRPPGPSN